MKTESQQPNLYLILSLDRFNKNQDSRLFLTVQTCKHIDPLGQVKVQVRPTLCRHHSVHTIMNLKKLPVKGDEDEMRMVMMTQNGQIKKKLNQLVLVYFSVKHHLT